MCPPLSSRGLNVLPVQWYGAQHPTNSLWLSWHCTEANPMNTEVCSQPQPRATCDKPAADNLDLPNKGKGGGGV